MRLVVLLATLMAASWASAQNVPLQRGGETFTINLRDAEVATLAEQVSRVTGRTLVIDPGLGGQITVISAEPLDQEGVWTLFQSILGVRGFVAVQSGVVWEVIPEAEARTRGGQPARVLAASQDVITEVVPLDRLAAEEAVRVLRPLVDDSGYLEALADPNAIVITDTRANVDRIAEIARSFDMRERAQTQVVRFRFADASTVGAAIVAVLGDDAAAARVSVDPSSNTLLARGTIEEISEIRRLAAAMDVVPRTVPIDPVRLKIFDLRYAEAEVVAGILRGALGGGGQGATPGPALINPVAVAVGAAEPAAALPAGAREAGAVSVQAAPESNAVIVRGTDAQIAEVARLIHALDVRRTQVMIEAAIVEVSGEVAERLGVQLGLGDATPPRGFAATSFSNGGTPLQSILLSLGAPNAVALSTGLAVGLGGNDFGALVQALAQSTEANLLSTPSITTLDNQAATIVVGQNVPFRTGTFATDGNTVAPFTTIERRDVGITLTVLPRISAGGIVNLEISQEVSSLANANIEGAVDLVTNRRLIETVVQAEDGGTVVLGGLISDDATRSEAKVPGLGDVPVVGGLFRSRQGTRARRTLFVFMRPVILHDAHDASAAARADFYELREAEAGQPVQAPVAGAPLRKLPLEIEGLY